MKLELDHNRKPFRPGDVITGHIELESQDAGVEKTHLVLEGRAKTKTIEKRNDHRATYRARAPLLYELHTIDMASAITYENGTKVIPFNLSIPLNVTEVTIPTTKDGLFKTYWNYNWGKPKPPFLHSAGHPLPPTFKAGPRGVFHVSSCYVEYSITAVGSSFKACNPNQPPGLIAQPLEPYRFDTKPFWLQSTCPASDETMIIPKKYTHQRIHVQSMRLLPEVQSRDKSKLTFKEKWKSMTSSSSVPATAFTARLHVPIHLHVDSHLHMSLDLKREMDHQVTVGKNVRPQVPFPDVTIDSIEIKVKGTTNVRTCGTMRMHTDDWNDTSWTDTQASGFNATLPVWAGEAPPTYSPRPSASTDGKPSMSSSTHAVDSSSHTFEFESKHPLPDRLIPTFETYNISRSYQIRVTVAMSCAGEKKFINYNGPLAVYSRSTAPPRVQEDVLPPAFEDVFDLESGQAVAGAHHGTSTRLAAGAGIGAGVAGAGLLSMNAMGESSTPSPAERMDSGVAGGYDDEDWGEYKLTNDDELDSQKMAGAAVEALSFVTDLAEVITSVC